MAEDILPNLLETIKQQIDQRIMGSAKLKAANQTLKAKQATYLTANELAIEVGEIMAEVLGANLSADILPDGRMYFNIAGRLLNVLLKKDFDIVSEYSSAVQKLLNKQAKIHLEAQRPGFNQDRVDGIVNRLASEPEFDKVKWILDDPIVNFSQSIVDDSIDVNARFQSRAGLHPTITRRVLGRGCAWCRNLAGTYEYSEAPHDIYRRHERCRCTVEYDPGSGKRQNVWSKKWRDATKDAKLEARKSIGIDPLARPEKAAIMQYVSSESYKLNDMMRRKATMPAEYQTMVTNLSNALDKMPRYKGTLNRSLTSWDSEGFVEFINQHEVGSIHQYDQFTSFSAGVYDENDDARIIIKQSKAGSDIRRFNPEEKEIIYKPSQKFVVVDRDLIGSRPVIVLEEYTDG